MHSNKNATSKKSYRGQWWWLSSLDCQSLVNETVGRVVASDTRGPRFESCHRPTFILDIDLFTINCIEKTEMKKKRPGMAHFLKKEML